MSLEGVVLDDSLAGLMWDHSGSCCHLLAWPMQSHFCVWWFELAVVRTSDFMSSEIGAIVETARMRNDVMYVN